MVEDRLLERAKVLTRLDPELLVERAADILVGGESVCLTAAAVEREHLVGAQPLLQRVAGDEQLQLRDEIGLAADARSASIRSSSSARCSSSSRATSGWTKSS